MTVHLLISFAADFLEDEHLLAFEVFDHCGFHVCTCDIGFPNLYSAIIVFEHHGVKRNLATLFVLKAVDEDLLILSYLELLSCDFYDCVHFFINLIDYFSTKWSAKVLTFFILTKCFLHFSCNILFLNAINFVHKVRTCSKRGRAVCDFRQILRIWPRRYFYRIRTV